MVAPEETYNVGKVWIKTLRSTDEGVAFLVEVDGYRIYHGGDLHWWHWLSAPKQMLTQMAADYCGQIDTLKRAGEIDVAFVPVDPRLGETYADGIDYFMRHVAVKQVVPMHFWGDFSVVDRLLVDEKTRPYRAKILKAYF